MNSVVPASKAKGELPTEAILFKSVLRPIATNEMIKQYLDA